MPIRPYTLQPSIPPADTQALPEPDQQRVRTHEILDLFRLTTSSSVDFLASWHNRHIPFIAAGKLAYGRSEWINRFPDNWLNLMESRAAIGERIEENGATYMGLFRMSLAFGHESPLTEKLIGLTHHFKREFSDKIVSWEGLGSSLNSEQTESGTEGPSGLFQQQQLLLEAGNLLKHGLSGATHNMEGLVAPMINSFLPALATMPARRLLGKKAR